MLNASVMPLKSTIIKVKLSQISSGFQHHVDGVHHLISEIKEFITWGIYVHNCRLFSELD